MDIGNRIRSIRKQEGITQAELAAKIGVSTITIRQYESGKRTPNIETLRRIARVLHYNLFGLLNADTLVDSPSLRLKIYGNPNQPQDEPTPDLVPSEFNDFERFIESFGYYTRLDGDHYRIHHGNDSVEITPDELKKLVRSSRKTVAALIEALIEEGRDNTAPAPEMPPEAPDGPPEAK